MFYSKYREVKKAREAIRSLYLQVPTAVASHLGKQVESAFAAIASKQANPEDNPIIRCCCCSEIIDSKDWVCADCIDNC